METIHSTILWLRDNKEIFMEQQQLCKNAARRGDLRLFKSFMIEFDGDIYDIHEMMHDACTRMTKELPPPFGGALCEVVGVHYGLKQSNHIYDQDLIKLLKDDGFPQTPRHPFTFIKYSTQNPPDKLIVFMHVDDGDGNISPKQCTLNSRRPSLSGEFRSLNHSPLWTLHPKDAHQNWN